MNYQSFHRVQNLFYLVLGIFIFSSFYRHLVTRFVGFLSAISKMMAHSFLVGLTHRTKCICNQFTGS
ncbi:hypothetical protein E1A91_A10G220200v1 [Gossypium mustelinum]|uniref:Uncharacterized protein n=1 Tax=Gossypium mustelinum TaxID=34275 RepID=A0A5D2XQU8_GOSMU|nr:hypothetical protein E1A91_A10G220200v1 [Gossypium mustelinum]TYJ15989.1 hypothetical protein E1A91_A10G220200v1 [Gossypium mustelinum]TYJ15990.1 hypothetical protein E1A91_A10G220200v1 [Gossypium mustelinum]